MPLYNYNSHYYVSSPFLKQLVLAFEKRGTYTYYLNQ